MVERAQRVVKRALCREKATSGNAGRIHKVFSLTTGQHMNGNKSGSTVSQSEVLKADMTGAELYTVWFEATSALQRMEMGALLLCECWVRQKC